MIHITIKIMTARVNKLTVILTDSIRVDDVQPLIDAISMLNRVASVELGDSSDIGIESMVEMRYQSSLMRQLYEFAKEFKID
ncbi:MAG: hypothetical protein ACC656_00250 [Candidatus Heimdallarchaeota archaeon]